MTRRKGTQTKLDASREGEPISVAPLGMKIMNSVLKMNPVVSQPGYGSAVSGSSDWQTGTFDCFDDIGICK